MLHVLCIYYILRIMYLLNEFIYATHTSFSNLIISHYFKEHNFLILRSVNCFLLLKVSGFGNFIQLNNYFGCSYIQM